jgi:hypothetical protein
MRRANSNQRPLREPSIPARFPAWLRSWQGNPPQMRSTGSSSDPLIFVMSPCRFTSGQCFASTRCANGSISTCQRQTIPARSSPRSRPPIPANREPKVTIRSRLCARLGCTPGPRETDFHLQRMRTPQTCGWQPLCIFQKPIQKSYSVQGKNAFRPTLWQSPNACTVYRTRPP